MDLTFTPEENAFRAELRTFFTTQIPQELRDKIHNGHPLTKQDRSMLSL